MAIIVALTQVSSDEIPIDRSQPVCIQMWCFPLQEMHRAVMIIIDRLQMFRELRLMSGRRPLLSPLGSYESPTCSSDLDKYVALIVGRS
jgi:hypothetical protein